MKDVNSATLVGRLTKDPEVRYLGSGTAVCTLRVAFSTSRKDAQGNWSDKSNFIDVTVWGKQAESCGKFLAKGRQIAVLGRLEFDEWQHEGKTYSKIQIQAEQVQFLSSGDQQGGGGGGQHAGDAGMARTDAPANTQDFAPASTPAVPADDDIPFKWDGVPVFEELKGTWRA